MAGAFELLAGLESVRLTLPEHPVFQGDDAVEAAGELEIVGRDQRREALGPNDLDQCAHDAGRGGVIEIAGRLSGRSSRPATCSIVDLPAPEGPTSATISPGASAR